MHALILTALLTGATAFGVTGYNNAQPKAINNNNEISHVQRAYYNPSQASSYGTDNDNAYNYSSYTITYVVYDEEEVTYQASPNQALYPVTLTHYQDGILYITFDGDVRSYSYTGASGLLDLYVNGTYYATLDPSNMTNDGCFSDIPLEGNEIDGERGYFWLFDHTEATMTDGIFEVMGDTITAFAGTIGVGISSMISIFYNEGITPLGILALITLGVALVWFAWNLVSNLLRQRH